MTTWEFTLVADAGGQAGEDLVDELYGRCDDATISTRGSTVIVEFDREAETFGEAVRSAIEDVEAAALTVERLEADELVTLSDIAERIGRTVESVRQHAQGLRGHGDFPPPAARAGRRVQLWYWSDVANWAQRHAELATALAEAAAETDPRLARAYGAAIALRHSKRDLDPDERAQIEALLRDDVPA